MRPLALLFGTTIAMVLITMLLVSLATVSSCFEILEGCWLLTTLLATPFWVVPLHLRLQLPRESSAGMAFLTGIPTWLISAAHALYLHVMTFGT